ncbi:hypothetical protein DY048_07015 [Apilactobacillus timberlakei]|uniref:Uncharacterized protein n=2 Tax=Apilactobacillus timberlakei TaxID=2008380 RepID=A0ABY2YS17_9LACO|nr:hypothetical protein DY048_07015 [Apilactobacillus timberlakei]
MCGRIDKQQAEKAKRMKRAEIKSQLTDYGLNHLGIGKTQNIQEKAHVYHKFIDLLNEMRVDTQKELNKYEVK